MCHSRRHPVAACRRSSCGRVRRLGRGGLPLSPEGKRPHPDSCGHPHTHSLAHHPAGFAERDDTAAAGGLGTSRSSTSHPWQVDDIESGMRRVCVRLRLFLYEYRNNFIVSASMALTESTFVFILNICYLSFELVAIELPTLSVNLTIYHC